MLKLADFNPNQSTDTSLKDFQPAGFTDGGPIVNQTTTNNIAAHASLLDEPANVMKAYSDISSELTTGSSVTLDALLRKRDDLDHKAMYDQLQSILADPNIPQDEKATYFSGYLGMTSDRPGNRSLNVLVAQEAAISPSAPDENDEAVDTLIPSDASQYDEVDQYNGWVQKQINVQANANNDDWFASTVNILESMVPFADQLGVLRTQAAVGKITNPAQLVAGLALIGNNKEEVRQAISRMPLSERYDFAQKVIDTVKLTGGSITGRPNTLAQINQLNAFLASGGYSDTDKWTDNIFSALDAVAFVPNPAKLFGAGVDAVRASSALKRAAKVEEAVIKSAEPDVAKTVESIKFETMDGRSISPTTNPEELRSFKPISDEDMLSAQETVAKTIVDKFKVTKGDKAAASPDMAQMILDTGMDYSSVYDDVLARVKQVYNGGTYYKEDIVQQISKAAQDALNSNNMKLPKTYKATTAQLVKKALAESDVNRLSVRTGVDQTSVSQTVKPVNPEKYRQMHEMVAGNGDDRIAQDLYGTTRDDALANDILPEVKSTEGTVRNKVSIPDEADPKISHETVDRIRENRGRTDLSEAEKIAMRAEARKNFNNVVGLQPRTAMGTVGDGAVDTPTGVSFDMVYGPTDGGFKSKEQAVTQALFAFRKYGITEGELEVLGKSPKGDFIPAKDGSFDSYLVRVKHDYEFTPADTVEYSTLSNGNWKLFDSRESWTDGRMGSLLQHFIPASSIINKVIFNSSTIASDRASWINKILVDLTGSYAEKFTKLDKRQKALVDSYRIEANEKNLKFNTANLKARGLSDDAIAALRDWKHVTDTMWWLENIDVNKTARARGWERFVDQTGNTDLLAKPVSNRGFGNGVRAFDSEKGQIVSLTKAEVDELYAKGGTIAQTRGTVEHGDDAFDMIIVKNNSESSYLRRVRDDDITLPYRDGYYPIKYTDTYFIEQQFKKADGSTYTKAIATAGSMKDAEQMFNRLRSTNKEAQFNIRSDYRMGSDAFDEANWSYLVSSGRSAQRVRGQRLINASGVTDPAHIHIESPEDSLIASIRSLSHRTAFRDWVETTKSRWMNKYGHLLEPQEGYKQLWPEDVRKIGQGKLQYSNAEVKDAKATWRHVRAMEAGYVNLLDDASKNFFKGFSDTAGRKGWGWVEKLSGAAAKGSPTAFVRKKAFRLLLAANPLRQAPVQAMQALPVLIATNPLAIPKIAAQTILMNFIKTGGDSKTFMKVMGKLPLGLTEKEAADLAKHYEMSGFEAAVDANSLIRDQISNIVDRTWRQKVQTVAAKPLNFMQKVGFNAGENFLMRTVWLSEYDILRKSGKKIDAASLEELNARVRNLTLNMNKAGELPYNENMFSAALQFFQAPHKAFAQILLGHKGLSVADRVKLGVSYVTTYGLGAGALTNLIMSQFNGDPATKEIVEGGLFNLTMNATLSGLFGQEVRTDFSDSLRLLDPEMVNPFAFFTGLMETDIPSVLTSGAGVGLVLGDNPRVTNFVKQLARPFMVDDTKKPEEMLLAGKAFLEMFSGGSNFFKAKYALEMQKSINGRGGVVDYHISSVEAILKAAGFSTIDEINRYASNEEVYRNSQKYKDDISLVIDETSKRLASQGISTDEENWYIDMMSEAQRVFENDPVYMTEFANQIKYKASTGENSIFSTLQRQMGYTPHDKFVELVNNTHMSDGFKKILLDSARQLEEIKNNG